jgi:hypothetical protein
MVTFKSPHREKVPVSDAPADLQMSAPKTTTRWKCTLQQTPMLMRWIMATILNQGDILFSGFCKTIFIGKSL